MKYTSKIALLLVTILIAQHLQADFIAPRNGGFEEGLTGWVIRDKMSQVTPEAARSGKFGLRVIDEDKKEGSSLYSSRYPVQAGQVITVTFDAKADEDFLGVYMWPVDASGQGVKSGSSSGGDFKSVSVQKGFEYQSYSVSQAMPEGAVAVSIWIHSWSSSTGVADLDNFKIIGLNSGVSTLHSSREVTNIQALEERKEPAIIILKLDDLRQINGSVHDSWNLVTDYLASKNIKSSIGIITETLESATPEYVDWITKHHNSGLVEFWFHGWDHRVWHDSSGKKQSEFFGRSFDQQGKRFSDSKLLAKEKLGFVFQTFGPGGGGSGPHQDAVTAQVMSSDPDMRVWLYPSPIDKIGEELVTQGKVTILDRVWAVNVEASVGYPDYDRFVSGYSKNPDRKYFVLQCHPAQWGSKRFSEFKKVINFLIANKAVFMTPVEYVAILNGNPAQ